ncbi:MAG: HNH endonuclease [Candidatus Moraniibacteriota bacterium]|nr:MAG: HNH endonuclease [Candidatus Moranbacteria bacterium]
MPSFENIFTNKIEGKESIFEKASLLRSRMKSRIELGDFPSPDFIFDCREIIALFRDIPHENVDRSARFSKSAKERLIKKIGGCSSCGGGVSGGSRQNAILEIHHIIPREHGGDESVENGISFCRNCHGEVHR